MMIENSSESYEAKQEGGDGIMKSEKLAGAGSTSRQWTSLRNPRIVRVSRSLGGKDRHSKVCTIRGLRDRRIRLSVPTAIQLYDLQDRLGLSQPSKVVDWLIEATQSDIDKLPPLDIPQCFTSHFHHHQLPPPGTSFSLGGFYDQNNGMAKTRYNNWDIDSSVGRLKGKEAENVCMDSEKSKLWMKSTNEQFGSNYFSNSSPSVHGLSSYHNLDPSSTLSLSQFGNSGNNIFPYYHQQVESHHNSGTVMQFSSSSFTNGNSQLLFCPSSVSLFSNNNNSLETTDNHAARQHLHHQILNSSSSSLSSSSSSSHALMMPLIPTLHLPINSPFRRLPLPFSSKLLDSDHDNNNTRNG
ncbi:uncharacterized protein [Cicer arietinum]|uniref:Transcription factor TCP17 n=1 Tax=Cicer arietinum TaxID=3827 RepID=A0A1S2YR82_CICAR|nr:transcription factor TCP17 [Cicer arietinum]